MADAPSGKRTRVTGGPLDVGGLNVEAEIRELKAQVQDVVNILQTASSSGSSSSGGTMTGGVTGVPLPTDLVTIPIGDGRYSRTDHSHPTLPTSAQKAGLLNITGSNRAIGSVEAADALRLGAAHLNVFIRKDNVPAGTGSVLDVTQLLIDQAVATGNLPGLLLNEICFIIDAVTLRPIEFNSYNVFGLLRQSDPFLLGLPAGIRSTLSQAYAVNGTSVFSSVPNLFPGGAGTIILGVTPQAYAVPVASNSGTLVTLNPGQTFPVSAPVGKPIFRAVAGFGVVRKKDLPANLWGAGDFEGDLLGVTIPNTIQVGSRVVINPGGVNQEIREVASISPAANPTLPTRIVFLQALDNDHEAGEPVILETMTVQTPQPRQLFVDFVVNPIGGGAPVPYVMTGQMICFLFPYRFRLPEIPVDLIQRMVEFLHAAGDSGGVPVGNAPTNLIEAIGISTFAGLGQLAQVIHNENLSVYAIMLTVRFDASIAAIGAFGVDLSTVDNNQFGVRNIGESQTKQFEYAILAIPPAALFSPLIDSGVATFSPAGTTVTHNKNIPFGTQFILIEPLFNAGMASLGVFALDTVQANSFVVRITGTNPVTQFRWALFNTGGLPLGKMRAAGVGTFAGVGVPATITHNLGIVGTYFVKIVPRFGPNLAAVGEYSVDPATRTGNAFSVRNTGSDNTTSFAWAIFVP